MSIHADKNAVKDHPFFDLLDWTDQLRQKAEFALAVREETESNNYFDRKLDETLLPYIQLSDWKSLLAFFTSLPFSL